MPTYVHLEEKNYWPQGERSLEGESSRRPYKYCSRQSSVLDDLYIVGISSYKLPDAKYIIQAMILNKIVIFLYFIFNFKFFFRL
jgi:hypothetical protein